MARLPIPGSDDNTWGDVLNDFLRQEHNEDGTLKRDASLGIAPVPRGTWTAQTNYSINDVVTNNRSAWRCTTAHKSSNVFQSQVNAGYWEQWSPRPIYYNVLDYGAKVDGGTDDTAAVQAAVNAAAAAGGGTVFIPQGFCMISQTIELKKHVWLRGAGMFATSLKLLPNANCDVIKNHISTNGTTDPNADFVGVLDITIDGNKANQSSGSRHGIVFGTNPLYAAASGDSYFDMHHIVRNVRVYKTGGDGVHLTGRSEIRLVNVYAAYPDGYGFYLTFDTFIIGCTAESAGLAGFTSTNGAYTLVNCKAFNCGQVVASSGAGFYLNGSLGGVTMTGCYAQNNQAQGFLLSGSNMASFSSCVADSNNTSNGSFAGFELNNSLYCTLSGCISTQGKQNNVQIGNQLHALRLVNGADKNTVNLSHNGNQGLVIGSALTADSVMLTNALCVNGAWLNPLFENQTNKGVAGGYAPLDASGLVPVAMLPVSAGGTPDATTTSKGVVQLAGDLGGTAAIPTVPGKVSKTGDSMTGSLTIQGTAALDILTAKTATNGAGLSVDQYGNTIAWQKLGIGSSNAPHTLSVTGSFGLPGIATVTTNTTLNGSQCLVVATQAITITLPSISGITGRIYCITNTSSGNVTVAAAASQTVLGGASVTLPAGGSLCVFAQGSNWLRFGSSI